MGEEEDGFIYREGPDYYIPRASSTYVARGDLGSPTGDYTPGELSLMSWLRRARVDPPMRVVHGPTGRFHPPRTAYYDHDSMTTVLNAARKVLSPQDIRPGFFRAEQGGAFVLGHEFGHHLQQQMGIGGDFPPQFDADLTGYVLAEKLGEEVSLDDSSATVRPYIRNAGFDKEWKEWPDVPMNERGGPISLLDLVKKRHAEIDSMVTAWGGRTDF